MIVDANRRDFLSGLVALVAAPAIVRASSLMAVKPVREYGHMLSQGLAAAFNEFKEIEVVRVLSRDNFSGGLNMAQLRELLRPGLLQVQGDYLDVPRQWDTVFGRRVKKVTGIAPHAAGRAWS